MPAEVTAIALIACACFGYGFFLGHWAGRREAKRMRQNAYRVLRLQHRLEHMQPGELGVMRAEARRR